MYLVHMVRSDHMKLNLGAVVVQICLKILQTFSLRCVFTFYNICLTSVTVGSFFEYFPIDEPFSGDTIGLVLPSDVLTLPEEQAFPFRLLGRFRNRSAAAVR